MLRFHAYQTHLRHREAHGCQTRPACAGVVQLKQLSRHRFIEAQAHAGWRQPGGQPLLGCHAVNHNPHSAEMVLCLGGPTGDPGGLEQTDLASDHQGVSRVFTAALSVVVLQCLEVTVGMKGVGSGEELWTGPNFTSKHMAEIKLAFRE